MRAFDLSTPLWLVVDALAAYRLTRLVTKDTILVRFRAKLMTREWLRWFDFVTCPWCVGVWVAATVVAATAAAPCVWVYPAVGLAIAAVAGIMGERL